MEAIECIIITGAFVVGYGAGYVAYGYVAYVIKEIIHGNTRNN